MLIWGKIHVQALCFSIIIIQIDIFFQYCLAFHATWSEVLRTASHPWKATVEIRLGPCTNCTGTATGALCTCTTGTGRTINGAIWARFDMASKWSPSQIAERSRCWKDSHGQFSCWIQSRSCGIWQAANPITWVCIPFFWFQIQPPSR